MTTKKTTTKTTRKRTTRADPFDGAVWGLIRTFRGSMTLEAFFDTRDAALEAAQSSEMTKRLIVPMWEVE